MLSYNRIAYELDGIKSTPADVEGLSMLMHFDYPEAWHLNGNAAFTSGSKFGTGCVYFPDAESNISIANTTGMYNIDTQGNYELEAFVKLKDRQAEIEAQGYRFYGGHTFKAFDTALTWTEAEEICEALGGHLATAPNAEKNTFLLSVVSGEYPWLGGQMVNDVWQWITGETWDYTNWGTSEPQVREGYVFDKLYMYHSNGTFGADANTDKGPFICEWDYDFREHDFTGETGINGCVSFNGHTFRYYNTATTWSTAKTACEELGGHLATSTSEEKNTFLSSLITSVTWLGATDEDTEGTWKWITGETWDYTNWYSTQPDNASSNEHYLRLSANSTWYDYSATTSGRYVCEWDYDFVGDTSIFATGNVLSLSGTVQKTTQTTSTLSGYSYFGGHTFKYYGTSRTWADAKAACEALGGHLATSTSAEKNTFLTTLSTARTWLGGTDETQEGTWKWITGETWSYTNWYSGEPSNSDSTEHYLEMGHQSIGSWNDEDAALTHGYICEWDYEMTQTTTPAAVEDILALEAANNGILYLYNWALGIDGTTTALTADAWHHILLRVSGEYIRLYVDGVQALSQYLSTEGTLSTDNVTLGGYVGWMDEFAFRRNAGSTAPAIPERAYGSEVITETVSGGAGNAPVSRVAWSCENLPAGLTLSESGLLSGRPTTAGTYECEFTVATNWGTDTKTVRITVE